MSLIIGISWLKKSLSGARTVYINECQHLMRAVMDRIAFFYLLYSVFELTWIFKSSRHDRRSDGFGTTIEDIVR